MADPRFSKHQLIEWDINVNIRISVRQMTYGRTSKTSTTVDVGRWGCQVKAMTQQQKCCTARRVIPDSLRLNFACICSTLLLLLSRMHPGWAVLSFKLIHNACRREAIWYTFFQMIANDYDDDDVRGVIHPLSVSHRGSWSVNCGKWVQGHLLFRIKFDEW